MRLVRLFATSLCWGMFWLFAAWLLVVMGLHYTGYRG